MPDKPCLTCAFCALTIRRKRRKTPTDRDEFKSVAYEVFILLVSLLSIVNAVVGAIDLVAHPLAAQPADVVLLMDTALTPLFLADFLYRLFTARSRAGYFVRGLGWLDLLSVVPGLRVLRIVRAVQVTRWLRRKGGHEVGEELVERRATATFLFTIFLVFLVVEVAGATIFAAESGDRNANIRTAGDALWWGLVTITTVGYGDRVPVTFGGRVIGVFLLFSGIALFSVLTGFIANVFLAPRPRPRRLRQPPRDETRAAIASLRELLADQEERTETIRQRIDELERSLPKGAPTPTES